MSETTETVWRTVVRDSKNGGEIRAYYDKATGELVRLRNLSKRQIEREKAAQEKAQPRS